jgi:hypothetical protein
MTGGHIVHRRDVFLRDDEDMRRRCPVKVVKGVDEVVFIDFLRGNLLLQDLAEQTIGTHVNFSWC